jgi:hypothetical protein
MLFIICSVLGATLTVVGLYSVLWGKKKESNVSNSCNESFNRKNIEQEVKVFVDETAVSNVSSTQKNNEIPHPSV